MKAYSKTIILFWSALVFVVVSGVAYTVLFVAMKNKTEETAALSVKSEELLGAESRALSARLVLKNDSVRIEKLSSYFIKESEIVAFARRVEELGPQSGTTLSIESLEPGLTEKQAPFLNFRIKANGKFDDVVRLLKLLENFPGKFEWKTVRLVLVNPSDAKTGGAPEWQVEVFLTALNFTKE